jgi:ribosomal protein S18 acetylase RimI-like enzyme
MPPDDIIAAVRRSDRAWCKQVCQWETLPFGVAYYSTRFVSLADANQLRDVWLAELDGAAAYEQAEAFYQQRGAKCQVWVPAGAQPVEPVEALLTKRGWRRAELTVMSLARRDAANAPPDVRILPARAMRRAYRATFAAERGATEASEAQSAEAAEERLNDANYDAFVAMVEQQPVGRIGYLEAGDIARLVDLWVLPEFRRRGVGAAMIARFVRIARRLSPRWVVASVAADDQATRGLLEKCGFATGGVTTEFHRLG